MVKPEEIKAELKYINEKYDYSPRITDAIKLHLFEKGYVAFQDGAVLLSVTGEKHLGVFNQYGEHWKNSETKLGEEISTQEDITECFFYMDGSEYE